MCGGAFSICPAGLLCLFIYCPHHPTAPPPLCRFPTPWTVSSREQKLLLIRCYIQSVYDTQQGLNHMLNEWICFAWIWSLVTLISSEHFSDMSLLIMSSSLFFVSGISIKWILSTLQQFFLSLFSSPCLSVLYTESSLILIFTVHSKFQFSPVTFFPSDCSLFLIYYSLFCRDAIYLLTFLSSHDLEACFLFLSSIVLSGLHFSAVLWPFSFTLQAFLSSWLSLVVCWHVRRAN